MRRQDATARPGLGLGEFQCRADGKSVAAVIRGEIGKSGDGLGLSEVAVADQKAADDVNMRMDKRRETIKSVR